GRDIFHDEGDGIAAQRDMRLGMDAVDLRIEPWPDRQAGIRQAERPAEAILDAEWRLAGRRQRRRIDDAEIIALLLIDPKLRQARHVEGEQRIDLVAAELTDQRTGVTHRDLQR